MVSAVGCSLLHIISNPMRCDGSRAKASMFVSEHNYTLLYITLTIA